MPELCRFMGIVIRMYAEFGERHHKPHFHAYYQGEAAIYGIYPVEFISGNLPKRQRRLVEAWAEIHGKELMTDWKLLHAGRTPHPINPLR
jgi:hypothetical protein